MAGKKGCGRHRTDRTGERRGLYILVKFLGWTKWHCPIYLARDIFGNEIETKGLYYKEFGKRFRHPDSIKRNRQIRAIYDAMIARCEKPQCPGYHDYGARGIAVGKEWRNPETGYANFRQWMIDHDCRTKDGWSLDRIDVMKGYFPKNCRRIPLSENVRWTRKTIFDWKKVKKLRKDYEKWSGCRRDFCLKECAKYKARWEALDQILVNKRWKPGTEFELRT